jgi:hypothetical protein
VYFTPYSSVIEPELRSGQLGLIITPDSHRPELYDIPELGCYWVADNGCFSRGESFSMFDYIEWLDSFTQGERDECLFATAPDVVGNWEATWERSEPVLEDIRALGYPVAIVVQDGATVDELADKWDRFDAVFTGGSTEWKLGPEAAAIAAEAEARGKWVHMGRVNSLKRMRLAAESNHHSADGTKLLFGPDQHRDTIVSWVEKIGREFGEVEWIPSGREITYEADETVGRGAEEVQLVKETGTETKRFPELRRIGGGLRNLDGVVTATTGVDAWSIAEAKAKIAAEFTRRGYTSPSGGPIQDSEVGIRTNRKVVT